MNACITVRAPAKINLALGILGSRPDGYHELDNLMMAVALFDTLEARPMSGECSLHVSGPAAAGVPCDGSNLALRAAEAVRVLARARGLRVEGVSLRLQKHIPARAGLGGGSADAAAAGLACARVWGLDPDDPEVVAAVARLGSDCAFFLRARRSGLARCTGRGERVEPLAAFERPGCLALVTPDFGCATAEVYRALGESIASIAPRGERERRTAPCLDPGALATMALETLRAGLANDLEAAAERVYPELARFRAHLESAAPGAFRLSGSGSSCFGFFRDEPSARAVLARLSALDEGRRYALRGQWLLPASSARMDVVSSALH